MHESKTDAVDDGQALTHVPLLVIGAGPYGLATAACAKNAGIEQFVVGKPMAFWRENMPAGMFLRSGPDWHLDAAGVNTFEAYLDERGIDPSEIDPIPVAVFLDYVDWFEERADIDVVPDLVRDLSRSNGQLRGDAGERPARRCRRRGRRPRHLPLHGHPGVGRAESLT